MDVLHTTGYHPRPPFLVAREQGFFAREGLAVDYQVTTYAPDHNAGMAVGKWDFTLSSADTMMARVDGDGTDYVLFMQGERGLDAHLVGAPGIASVADLRGKLLAGDPGDSNLDVVRLKIMRDNGIGDGEYDVRIIGSSPVRLEALLRGEVVAAMLPPPHDAVAVAAGCRRLAAANDYVRDYPLMCGSSADHLYFLCFPRHCPVQYMQSTCNANELSA
jgi:ABC-type nitrate/sulfonate/bicarbonate transport system substrate-binding protein